MRCRSNSSTIDGYDGSNAKLQARIWRDGAPVKVQFFAIDPVTAEGRATPRPFVERINFSQPNLPAGSYELEVSGGRGWSTVREPVELVAGETARVRIELRRSGPAAD